MKSSGDEVFNVSASQIVDLYRKVSYHIERLVLNAFKDHLKKKHGPISHTVRGPYKPVIK